MRYNKSSPQSELPSALDLETLKSLSKFLTSTFRGASFVDFVIDDAVASLGRAITILEEQTADQHQDQGDDAMNVEELQLKLVSLNRELTTAIDRVKQLQKERRAMVAKILRTRKKGETP